MEKDLLYQTKSKFNVFVRISIDIIPASCYAASIGAAYMFFAMINDTILIHALKIFGIIYLIATTIILSILIKLKQKAFNTTLYKIYKDRIEIIKKHSKNDIQYIYFRNVQEVHCHKGSLTQIIAKLGDIIFITYNDTATRTIPDIENPEKIYDMILPYIENSDLYSFFNKKTIDDINE